MARPFPRLTATHEASHGSNRNVVASSTRVPASGGNPPPASRSFVLAAPRALRLDLGARATTRPTTEIRPDSHPYRIPNTDKGEQYRGASNQEYSVIFPAQYAYVVAKHRTGHRKFSGGLSW